MWTSNKSAIDFKTIQFRQSKQKNYCNWKSSIFIPQTLWLLKVMYVWGRSAVQVTKELENSLRHFSLNTGALQGSVWPGKVSSLQNTAMVQTDFCFSSWSEHIILHNLNPAFFQCFTAVFLMKQKRLNLLSWLAKENTESICIIHSHLKHFLFFRKMFRVCCSASLNASSDRCRSDCTVLASRNSRGFYFTAIWKKQNYCEETELWASSLHKIIHLFFLKS